MSKKQIEDYKCRHECPRCIWWDCPIIREKHNFLHQKDAVARDKKYDFSTLVILFYCSICDEYFIRKKTRIKMREKEKRNCK